MSDPQDSVPVTLAALTLYPVKGCRGIAVDTAEALVTGLAWQGICDREWMVVDAVGRFVTQRELPSLALVVPSLRNGALQLRCEGREPLQVPLSDRAQGSRCVTVWRSDVLGFDAGDAAAEWLAAVLGRPLRLVRFDRAKPRHCNRDYVGDSGAHTLFADGYPMLVTNEASLADVNARLAARGLEGIPMNRFRPNVVVAGLAKPYAEDVIESLRFGEVELKLVKGCTRCKVTATDQATAQVGVEPLRMLASYRLDEELQGVVFGMNAIVARGAGTTLQVGLRGTARFRA